jgi:hypothetical protein
MKKTIKETMMKLAASIAAAATSLGIISQATPALADYSAGGGNDGNVTVSGELDLDCNPAQPVNITVKPNNLTVTAAEESAECGIKTDQGLYTVYLNNDHHDYVIDQINKTGNISIRATKLSTITLEEINVSNIKYREYHPESTYSSGTGGHSSDENHSIIDLGEQSTYLDYDGDQNDQSFSIHSFIVDGQYIGIAKNDVYRDGAVAVKKGDIAYFGVEENVSASNKDFTTGAPSQLNGEVTLRTVSLDGDTFERIDPQGEIEPTSVEKFQQKAETALQALEDQGYVSGSDREQGSGKESENPVNIQIIIPSIEINQRPSPEIPNVSLIRTSGVAMLTSQIEAAMQWKGR